MSHHIRPKRSGACVFFTVALQDRSDDLLLRHIARLRSAVAQTRDERPFDIIAWVALPDHKHCIWRLPEGDADFPTRWRLIKGRFSHGLAEQPRSASKELRGEKGIWQRRYWEHHIRDDADMERHITYCWLDPVRHGLVERAEDWPFLRVRPRYPFGAMAEGLNRAHASTGITSGMRAGISSRKDWSCRFGE